MGNREFQSDDIEKLAGMIAREVSGIRADMESGFSSIRADMESGFSTIREDLAAFKEETRVGFRDVRADLDALREISISLSEQDELRRRLHRVEEHLGLPHEVA